MQHTLFVDIMLSGLILCVRKVLRSLLGSRKGELKV